MLHRPEWMWTAFAAVLSLCACGGGGHDGRVGACVVDGTRTCTDNVSVSYCQGFLYGDHFYEAMRCKDIGYPK